MLQVMPNKPPEPLYRQPFARLRVWGISCPHIDAQTGHVNLEHEPDFGTEFDVYPGAPADRRYGLCGEVDHEVFMATLELAKVRQLKRIARALEKMAGIEHDEPADPTRPMKPKED